MPPPKSTSINFTLVISRQLLLPGVFPRPLLHPLADLLCPALVDGGRDDVIEILGVYVADEEDLHVVFHGDQLRVVHARLARKPFAGGLYLQTDRPKTKPRLAFKQLRLGIVLVDDAVLGRFHSSLLAPLPDVCQDRTRGVYQLVPIPIQRSAQSVNTYTQVQWPSSFATTIKRRKPT